MSDRRQEANNVVPLRFSSRPERDAEMIRLYRNGHHVNFIAKECGVRPSYVRQRMSKYGVTRGGVSPRKTAALTLPLDQKAPNGVSLRRSNRPPKGVSAIGHIQFQESGRAKTIEHFCEKHHPLAALPPVVLPPLRAAADEPIGCRYIEGDPSGGGEWRYCQGETKENSSYCPAHHARCYRPAVMVVPAETYIEYYARVGR